MKIWITRHQLSSFFILAFAIMFGVMFGYLFLQPGQALQPWSLVWFLSIFSPSISAFFVSWIIGGSVEIKRTFAGFARWKVNPGWYFAAAFLLIGPLGIALVYALLGNPVTGLKPGVTIPILLGTVLFTFFSGPFAEEAGWRGFALPRLEAKHSALVSSLILGVIWTCWHIPLFFISGATQMSIPFPIYLVLVTTVTFYLTWLYNNTRGSLIITILAHFAYNLTGTLITGPLSLMPAMKFYMTAGPLLFLIVVGIVISYKPKYFSKKQQAELLF